MNEPKSKNEKPKEERRFSQEQYDFLKKCSEKGEEGIREWNEWRKKKENRHKDIELEGAPLGECYLKDVHLNLRGGYFLNDDGTNDTSKKVCSNVHLKCANLSWAHLEGAALMNARLNGAKLWFARLQGADVSSADLRGAELMQAKVDGGTTLWKCQVDRKTNAEGVALDRAVIDPGTKQLLEYNIRRRNWEEWYEDHPKLKWVVKPFWMMSDYGLSTGRIIITFFGLALIFANIYYYWGAMDYYILRYILRVDSQPGFVENLFVYGNGIEVQWWLVPLRTLYFSIVTMTTLGFGDMYANAQSILGHLLLMIQVILGYVLLGALITRFAVLFTAGGPAGKFTNEKKPQRTQRNTEKLKI